MNTTPPTARAADVTEARALALDLYAATHLYQRNDAYEEYQRNQFVEMVTPAIAAALAAREAVAVERCARAVCSLCREAHQGVEGVGAAHLRDEVSWVHKLTLSTQTQSLFGCDASNIRADAARRETK